MIKNAGIILARMDSRRFPKKVLMPIGGIPLLECCAAGVLRTKSFSPILATTTRPVDQPLVDFAAQIGVPCFRGDLDNVYQRVCKCLSYYGVDIFARINGDSPFVQADLLDAGLDLLEQQNCDFVTNLVPRRFPYGVSVEICRSKIFLQAENFLSTAEHKEHITSYFYQNLSRIRHSTLVGESDLSSVRLTIDTPEDLKRIERMQKTEPDILTSSLSKVLEIYQQN